jgi:D-alanyl-lipoteichoic acid acyltransferase DltB (MBOAT superfamily)
MLFNTIDFVIFFIVVLTTLAVVKKRKFQHLFLLTASYFFFYYSSNYLITLLIFTTIWDFYLGDIIYKTKNIRIKKLIFITSLAGNLGLLGFFKYADFVITQFNFLGHLFDLETQIPLLHLALPIAISFYTFHSLTYTITIYRGQMEPVKSLTEYAIFVAFFPQLVAGPILRAKDFLPQLKEKIENLKLEAKLRQIVIHESNLKIGITIMAFGFLKKMFFADNIAPMVNDIFSNPVGSESLTVILGAIAFGIQIYGDFSGYSDIAFGAAIIMGFKIPINFNKPYFASSPSDFWRRWHISLSSWLRDYLYIPLGGNKKSNIRTYINLLSVMVIGGLWHGASLTFVLWGTMHGLYLTIHRLISNKFPFLPNYWFFRSKIGKILSICIMQYLVFLAWIPFRSETISDATLMMEKFVFIQINLPLFLTFLQSHELSFGLIFLFLILHYISFRVSNLVEKISKLGIIRWSLVIFSIMFVITFFYNGNPEDFVYFRF